MAGRTRKCPQCGGKVVRIIYGMPGPELWEESEDKKVLLGGCCISDHDPDRGCVDCEWVEYPPGPRWMPGLEFMRALALMVELHGGDVRKIDNEPYIGHLLGVASLVLEHGGNEVQTTAALFHDTIEDTATTYDELARLVGPLGTAVTMIVDACTDATKAEKDADKALAGKDPDKKRELWLRRKQAYIARLRTKEATDPSLVVVLADKVNNGEKTARDYARDPKLFGKFNAGYEDQCAWYTALVDAFEYIAPPEPVSKLVDRLRIAVESIFPAHHRQQYRWNLGTKIAPRQHGALRK